MEIVVSQEQGRVPVTVFHITGEINVETSDQLQKRAVEAHKAGACDFLLDLSNVPYISSYGIRTLSEIYRMLRDESQEKSQTSPADERQAGVKKAAHLKLLKPSSQVQRVLSTAGLDLFVETYTDMKTAIASF